MNDSVFHKLKIEALKSPKNLGATVMLRWLNGGSLKKTVGILKEANATSCRIEQPQPLTGYHIQYKYIVEIIFIIPDTGPYLHVQYASTDAHAEQELVKAMGDEMTRIGEERARNFLIDSLKEHL